MTKAKAVLDRLAAVLPSYVGGRAAYTNLGRVRLPPFSDAPGGVEYVARLALDYGAGMLLAAGCSRRGEEDAWARCLDDWLRGSWQRVLPPYLRASSPEELELRLAASGREERNL